LETVGNTPLVRIKKMPELVDCKAKVYLKLEMQNPGGSLKDRIALNMIEEAEKSGKLKPGMTIVEATSGNTGIGICMVAAAKGYKTIIIMPQVPPMLERYMIARQFGAEVHLTAAAKGAPGIFQALEELVASDPEKYFPTNQFTNLDNPETHVKSTGPELMSQTNGEIDVFVHGIGTGGCISGVGKYLKEQKPSVKIVAIEPSNSRVHVGEKPNPHTIVGIGAGVITNFLNMPIVEGKATPLEGAIAVPGVVDEWAHASGDESTAFATRVCREEGIMIGPSGGAAVKVALEQAKLPENEGKTIVAIIASHGIRYTAHPMWAAIKKEGIAALPAPPNMDKDVETVQWKSEDYKPE